MEDENGPCESSPGRREPGGMRGLHARIARLCSLCPPNESKEASPPRVSSCELAALALRADVSAEDVAGCTALHRAAQWGQAEAVEVLLQRGSIVNASDHGGYTPLHYAAAGGHRAVAEVLLGNGADRQARAADGKTPLEVAQDHGQHGVVSLLRARPKGRP